MHWSSTTIMISRRGQVYSAGDGSDNTGFTVNGDIEYTGKGSLLVQEDVFISGDFVTPPVGGGSPNFPASNIVGIMTPGRIDMETSHINVMGIFYAEDTVKIPKQTDVVGSIVSQYFDMGTNVPAIFQVPDVSKNLPPGMISGDPIWLMEVVSWRKI